MRKITIPKIKFTKKKQAEKENEIKRTRDDKSIEKECPTHYCMYCGAKIKYYGSNPADFLHYSDKDVFGKKFVCPFCDVIITQSNRMFYQAMKAKQDNDKTLMLQRLKLAARLLNQAVSSYENGDWEI